jgi:hypothetical protein
LGFVGTVWYILFVPETKGKTLEEITAAFKDYQAGKVAAKGAAAKARGEARGTASLMAVEPGMIVGNRADVAASTSNPLQMP